MAVTLRLNDLERRQEAEPKTVKPIRANLRTAERFRLAGELDRASELLDEAEAAMSLAERFA